VASDKADVICSRRKIGIAQDRQLILDVVWIPSTRNSVRARLMRWIAWGRSGAYAMTLAIIES
jgi:hypothetical protein